MTRHQKKRHERLATSLAGNQQVCDAMLRVLASSAHELLKSNPASLTVIDIAYLIYREIADCKILFVDTTASNCDQSAMDKFNSNPYSAIVIALKQSRFPYECAVQIWESLNNYRLSRSDKTAVFNYLVSFVKF